MSALTQLLFTIPADHWLSANDRMHWAPKSKRTAALRDMGNVMAHVYKIPRHDVTHVAAFIGYLRNGKADPANAAPTVKALIDGMVDAGVWADDDSTHVIGPTYLRDPKSPTPEHYTVRLVLTSQEVPW
jgi:crossover junction endodeoxyribonuclease RusA